MPKSNKDKMECAHESVHVEAAFYVSFNNGVERHAAVIRCADCFERKSATPFFESPS